MADPVEQLIREAALRPRQPIDPQAVWREARGRSHRLWAAVTAGTATLVLLAGLAAVAAAPARVPAPVIAPPPAEQVEEAPQDEVPETVDTPEEPGPEPEPEVEAAPEPEPEPAPAPRVEEPDEPSGQTPSPEPTRATTSHRSSRQLLGRTFVVTSITEDGAPRPSPTGAAPGSTQLEVDFERSGDDDLVRWSGSCNTSGATVVITATRLLLGEIGGTAMGCDEELEREDRWVHDFFASDPSWQLDGDRLTLASGTTLVELREAGAAGR